MARRGFRNAFIGAGMAFLLVGGQPAVAEGRRAAAGSLVDRLGTEDGFDRFLEAQTDGVVDNDLYRIDTASGARAALYRLLSVIDPASVPAAFRSGHAPKASLTMLYRDLAFALPELQGAERVLAERVLARPTAMRGDGYGYAQQSEEKSVCSDRLCVVWVEGTADAPPPVDGDLDGVPDQVETTAAVFEQVWDVEVGNLGYRAPKPDAEGPNDLLDIYLSDLGSQGAYGACVPQPDLSNYEGNTFDVPGYCQVDNDFSPTQFPGESGLPALQVTAAHEFFHAVQFAYDALEDLWMMEGTAVWMEDVVYDEIDDHLQYLSTSALAHPELPLDFASQEAGTAYGSWLYWRFLSEYTGTFDPSIIKAIWDRADGSAGAPDDYSLVAIDNVLQTRGTTFRASFADYTALNNFAELVYEEGEAYVAAAGHPPFDVMKFSKSRPKRAGVAQLDHLSSVNVLLRRGKGITSRAKIRITFDLPAIDTGPEATVQVLKSSGDISFQVARLSDSGDGKLRVSFGKGKVEGVLVTLTNASTRFTGCFAGSPDLACSGTPLDDGARYKIIAKVIQ